jgi:diguanylate cyclase (GGDEF)-like protein/PAS domain S-box-containing protein
MVFAGEASTRTLVVGSEQDYPPFALGQTDATADGFTVELWKAVAKEAGVNYTIHVRPFHQVLQEFKEGKIDVLINLAQSDERRRFVDFSVPHVTVHGAIFVRKNEFGVRSEADFAGKSIIVLNADLAHDYAVAKGWEKQLVLVDTAADGFKLLASGQHDVMLISKLAGMQTLQKLKISNIKALDAKAGFAQKFSFAVHKGNAELLARINEGLALTKPSGVYDALYEKWFGPYEEKGVTFRDLLQYLVPIGLVLLGIAGFEFYKRRIEHKRSEEALRQSEERFRYMLETSPIAVRIAKSGGRSVVFANQRYEDLINVEPRKAIGEDPETYYEHQEEYEDVLRQLTEGGQVFNRLVELAIPGYGKKWALASYLPIQYEGEAAVLGWFYDVTDRKQVEDALRRREEVFSAIVNQAVDGIVLFDAETLCFVEFNTAACDALGYSREEFSQLTLYDLQYKYTREQVAEGVKNLLESGSYIFEHQHRRKDGSPQDLRASNRVVSIGGKRFVATIWTDITERKRAEEKLTLAARVFSDAHEGITITDANGTIIDVNPTFCEITGYSREEVIGQNPRILSSGKQGAEFYAAMWKALAEQGHWQGEVWNRKKDGEIYAELLTISALRDGNSNILHYIGLFSDITQSKYQQQTLEMMAHYDVLTKLPNRALFADRFVQAIARSKRDDLLLAVCYLDLDGFKLVNDSLGHDAGDQLLVEVAERIKSSLREEDTVSRLGGDEFALLIGGIETFEQCEQAMERVYQTIKLPYLINDQSVSIAASSGVTLYPLDDAAPDTLLRHADQAMYQAKLAGRNRYHLFDAEHDQQVQNYRQLLEAIERAFDRNEFCLYYQPKVDMRKGDIIGAEALIRWNHPERGLVLPAEFLPVTEGTPFEIVLGNWVIEQALNQLDAWRKEKLDIQVSVNVSPRHLRGKGFFAQLDSALTKHPGIPAHQLELEVLESSMLGDLTSVSDVIKGCRDTLGVSIALDDFGTGYSSLTHLRHLSASTIKIDQSFVRDMIDDPNDYAIVEGVIGLANAFRRSVIAEGVETQEHGLMLLALGCTVAQGYGIARPMPAELILPWVKDFRPYKEWLTYAENPPPQRSDSAATEDRNKPMDQSLGKMPADRA